MMHGDHGGGPLDIGQSSISTRPRVKLDLLDDAVQVHVDVLHQSQPRRAVADPRDDDHDNELIQLIQNSATPPFGSVTVHIHQPGSWQAVVAGLDDAASWILTGLEEKIQRDYNLSSSRERESMRMRMTSNRQRDVLDAGAIKQDRPQAASYLSQQDEDETHLDQDRDENQHNHHYTHCPPTATSASTTSSLLSSHSHSQSTRSAARPTLQPLSPSPPPPPAVLAKPHDSTARLELKPQIGLVTNDHVDAINANISTNTFRYRPGTTPRAITSPSLQTYLPPPPPPPPNSSSVRRPTVHTYVSSPSYSGSKQQHRNEYNNLPSQHLGSSYRALGAETTGGEGQHIATTTTTTAAHTTAASITQPKCRLVLGKSGPDRTDDGVVSQWLQDVPKMDTTDNSQLLSTLQLQSSNSNSNYSPLKSLAPPPPPSTPKRAVNPTSPVLLKSNHMADYGPLRSAAAAAAAASPTARRLDAGYRGPDTSDPRTPPLSHLGGPGPRQAQTQAIGSHGFGSTPPASRSTMAHQAFSPPSPSAPPAARWQGIGSSPLGLAQHLNTTTTNQTTASPTRAVEHSRNLAPGSLSAAPIPYAPAARPSQQTPGVGSGGGGTATAPPPRGLPSPGRNFSGESADLRFIRDLKRGRTAPT